MYAARRRIAPGYIYWEDKTVWAPLSVLLSLEMKYWYVFEVIPFRSKHLYSLMWAFEREHSVCSWPRPHLLITALLWKYSGSCRKVDFKDHNLLLDFKLEPWAAYFGLKFLKLHTWNDSGLLFSSIWSCIGRIFILSLEIVSTHYRKPCI